MFIGMFFDLHLTSGTRNFKGRKGDGVGSKGRMGEAHITYQERN